MVPAAVEPTGAGDPLPSTACQAPHADAPALNRYAYLVRGRLDRDRASQLNTTSPPFEPARAR